MVYNGLRRAISPKSEPAYLGGCHGGTCALERPAKSLPDAGVPGKLVNHPDGDLSIAVAPVKTPLI